LKESYKVLSHRDELIHNETGEGLEEKTGGASEDGDILFIVTVCCEEGRHRSVALVGGTSLKAYTADNRG
jgi:RNase adaptor protein for sRNA GlmZ degradation